MSLATIECLNQTWVAEEEIGDSRRHKEIAAGAHRKRTPFCRQHKNSRQNLSRILPQMYDSVGGVFDFHPDSDILVVRHDLDVDPFEELEQLQALGRKIIYTSGVVVPDFGYLDRVNNIGPNNHPFNTSAELTPSEIDDLTIASKGFTRMMLERHND